MQFGLMLKKMEQMAKAMGEGELAQEYENWYQSQRELVNTKAWDGAWFRRAIMDSGEYVGKKDSQEAKIWLNTQSWAVLSGMGDREKCLEAMDSVHRILDTPMGIKKIHPPIVNFPDPKEPLTNYNPGTGENGSVFCHANTWAIIAECMLGHGDQAYSYYRKLIPAVAMKTGRGMAVQGRAVCVCFQYLWPGQSALWPGQRILAHRHRRLDVCGRDPVYSGNPPFHGGTHH